MSDNAQQQKQAPWIKSSKGVVEVYANTMHLTWSLDDLRLRLGQMVDHPDTPNPGEKFAAASEERAAVTFTWRNAKILRDQLTAVIDLYEKTNGVIKTDIKLPGSL